MTVDSQWIRLGTAVDVQAELEAARMEIDLLQREVDAKDAENLELHRTLLEAEEEHGRQVRDMLGQICRLERAVRR